MDRRLQAGDEGSPHPPGLHPQRYPPYGPPRRQQRRTIVEGMLIARLQIANSPADRPRPRPRCCCSGSPPRIE
eukprot:80838-Pyramimonas_sp.AAC.1